MAKKWYKIVKKKCKSGKKNLKNYEMSKMLKASFKPKFLLSSKKI